MVCKICTNGRGNAIFQAREMMFGTRDVFRYMECSGCGCVQLLDIPLNLEKYYPREYYSFEEPETFSKTENDLFLARFLRRQRSMFLFENRSVLGRALQVLAPAQPKLMQYVNILGKCRVGLASNIIDIGCGRGKMLSELSWYGFSRLSGADPYIESDLGYGTVRIYKKDIFSIEGQFDLVMFNHSFEHMDNPFGVLSRASDILAAGGRVLIRIPTVSSYAWEYYRENWFGLDAPRHLFLYSIPAINVLAEKTGFSVKEIIYESTEAQFWASEQYIKDIPLRGSRSYDTDPRNSIFTPDQIKEFEKKARELNEIGKGDMVCIILEKITRRENDG